MLNISIDDSHESVHLHLQHRIILISVAGVRADCNPCVGPWSSNEEAADHLPWFGQAGSLAVAKRAGRKDLTQALGYQGSDSSYP